MGASDIDQSTLDRAHEWLAENPDSTQTLAEVVAELQQIDAAIDALERQ